MPYKKLNNTVAYNINLSKLVGGGISVNLKFRADFLRSQRVNFDADLFVKTS